LDFASPLRFIAISICDNSNDQARQSSINAHPFPSARIWCRLPERHYGNPLIIVRARDWADIFGPYYAFLLDLSIHFAIADLKLFGYLI